MKNFSKLLHSLPGRLRRFAAKIFRVRVESVSEPLLSAAEIQSLRHQVNQRHRHRDTRRDSENPQVGDSRSVFRGYGWDYEESRLYQAGDETRFMNWSATARTGQLYMKVFREERRPNVFLLLDRRLSMRFGTRTRLKVTQAARSACCISFDALLNHASLGGVVLQANDPQPQWIAETSGERAAHELIAAANSSCQPMLQKERQEQNTENTAGIGQILHELTSKLTCGTRLYLISDFVDLKESHRASLMQLSVQHQIHAIHVFDPAEQQLPVVGKVRFQTSSDRDKIELDTNAANVNLAFAEAARIHFRSLKRYFTSLNIEYTLLSSQTARIENSIML